MKSDTPKVQGTHLVADVSLGALWCTAHLAVYATQVAITITRHVLVPLLISVGYSVVNTIRLPQYLDN